MKVRVTSVISIRDPNGNLGKRIDLVEELEQMNQRVLGNGETHRIIIEATNAMQLMMPPALRQVMAFPKIILLLTEEECEKLGVEFKVNEEYDVTLEKATMKFMKSVQDGEPE